MNPMDAVQCTATNRLGERCKRYAVEGSSVCRLHGGASPLARAAAKKMLLALVPDAIEVLKEALDGDVRIDVVQLRAALAVLDRAGFGPRQTISIDAEPEALKKLTDEELKARAQQVMNWIAERQKQATTNDEGTSATPGSSSDVIH